MQKSMSLKYEPSSEPLHVRFTLSLSLFLQGWSPAAAWSKFQFENKDPFVPFRDASFEPLHFPLYPSQVLLGTHLTPCVFSVVLQKSIRAQIRQFVLVHY